MLSNPEVSYTRQHPDKQVRPPPKSFADFQNEAKVNNPDGTKGTYLPPKGSAPELEATPSQTDVRLGLLEQRIECLEGELEELTDAATKPNTSASASFIAHLVRLTVVDGLVSPEAALLAIARELGLVEVAAKLGPAAPFRAPMMGAPFAPPAAPPKERPAETTHFERAPVAPPERKRMGRPPNVVPKKDPAQAEAREAVRARMNQHGLSQNRVADIAGFQQSALSRWLRGSDAKDLTFIKKVEKAIDKLV
jgi:hypothetical protein